MLNYAGDAVSRAGGKLKDQDKKVMAQRDIASVVREPTRSIRMHCVGGGTEKKVETMLRIRPARRAGKQNFTERCQLRR